MINNVIFKVRKRYSRWQKTQAKSRQEGFVKSLNEVQLAYFQRVQSIFQRHADCICFKQDNVIILELSVVDMKYFCSIAVAASESVVTYTEFDLNSKKTKHVEVRYFNDHASVIFENMLEECLKRKRREHEATRNLLIS